MPRTTTELVEGIIEIDEGFDITPFIVTANALVTELCAPRGYDDERLELIERYLAAHFYTAKDQSPRATGESAGPVSASYQAAYDLLLYWSYWGQTAMMLDTSGALKALSEKAPKQKLSLTWLGTVEE